jgi:hypothetical protein
MDQQPAEIQQEIEQRRRSVVEKLTNLRNRLDSDKSKAQSAVQRQAIRAGRRALPRIAFFGALGAFVTVGMVYSVRRNRSRKLRQTGREDGRTIHAVIDANFLD